MIPLSPMLVAVAIRYNMMCLARQLNMLMLLPLFRINIIKHTKPKIAIAATDKVYMDLILNVYLFSSKQPTSKTDNLVKKKQNHNNLQLLCKSIHDSFTGSLFHLLTYSSENT